MSERTEKLRIIADERGDLALRLIADELDTHATANEIEQLRIQLRCGVTDPRTDENHPGHLLIVLGWGYQPGDVDGCEWVQPSDSSCMTLAQALGVELRGLLTNTPSEPAREAHSDG